MGYAAHGPGRCRRGSWWKPTLASPASDAARSLQGAGRACTRSGQVCSPRLVDIASKVGLGLIQLHRLHHPGWVRVGPVNDSPVAATTVPDRNLKAWSIMRL